MDNDKTVDPTTQRFELQKSLLENGLDQVQKQIIHLDDTLFKIKTSAITVWVALMGWALTGSKILIVPLGFVVIIGFWLLEGMFKGVQIRYMEISANLMHVVNDTDSLQHQFEARKFQNGIIYPVALKLNELDRLILMWRGIISPTIATAYMFLAFANALVWMALG